MQTGAGTQQQPAKTKGSTAIKGKNLYFMSNFLGGSSAQRSLTGVQTHRL